jgi:class 3 adenylate cyclase/tetratricopeptide (TPR) repeat protein
MTMDASLGRPHADSRATDAERKLVTVLFADVAGFTTLAETLDPEPLRDLINACFGRLVPCVERYGGTVDKFIGDEIMALFGAPMAHDNDPERAVRAALDMREALQAFNTERGTALQAHFGLNTGLVLAGAVGAGSRTEYSVMGDAVNVASRLAETAAPGEVLVGPDTHRVAGHLFQCEEAGPVRIRGRAEALTVYRVLGVRDAAGPATTRPGRWVGSPLVGREREKEAFVAALDRLPQDEGGILAVVGDAGLGKSRLTAEVRRLADPELTWLEGRTLSFGRQLSYWPFLELLQAAAGIDTDDGEAERSAKLERLVGRLFEDEASDVLPYLATLLALPVPEELHEKVRYLGGDAMGRQVFRTMRLFVSRLAKEHPLVLVFEDVHWLDDSSASLLEHLLPLTKEAQVLFCLVGRPEPDSPTQRLQHLARETYADRYQELLLAPLSLEETHALVTNLVGLRDLPVRLRDTIDQRAEGNPLFVEEVIRALVDLGGLVADQHGRWQITERAAQIRIPDTLQGVIMARVDRLDEELKQVLRLAAVVGRSFFYRVLAALAEAEARLDQDLATLQGLELIREKAHDPELEYIFKHALVQEATYESILLQRRRGLHLRVAQAIEGLFADRLEEFYGLLAYHYTKAEDWEKAQEYLFKAGDQAGKIAADEEALAHYHQAMEAYARVFGQTWDPFQRGVLERKMGDALFRLGRHERAREYYYRAMECFGYPLPASPGALKRGIAREAVRQGRHRLAPWSVRASAAPEKMQIVGELTLVMKSLAWIESVFDPARSLYERLLVLNLCETVGLERAVCQISASLAYTCDVLPAPRTARLYHRRALQIAQRLGEHHLLGWVLWRLGQHHLMWARFESATEHFLDAAEHHRAAGNIHDYAVSVVVAADSLMEQGRLEEGLELARSVVLIGEEAGDRLSEARGRAVLGELLYRRGALAEAEAELFVAEKALVEATELVNGAKSGGQLGLVYLRQGRLADALAILEEHRTRLEKQGLKSYWTRNVWAGLATARLMIAEQKGPQNGPALQDAREACERLLRQGQVDRGAFVLAYRMQGTCLWLEGKQRKAEQWWRKSVALAVEVGARYDEAATRLQIGRRLDDRAELEQAEAMFAEMGAAFDLAEARRLLGAYRSPEAATTANGLDVAEEVASA